MSTPSPSKSGVNGDSSGSGSASASTSGNGTGGGTGGSSGSKPSARRTASELKERMKAGAMDIMEEFENYDDWQKEPEPAAPVKEKTGRSVRFGFIKGKGKA